MRSILTRAIVASAVGVVLIAVLAGVSLGAAGDPLILGSTSNNSGTSRTALTANTASNSFVVYNTGSGAALRGYNKGTGDGVVADTKANQANGLRADNLATSFNSTTPGTAILGLGGKTWGVVGTTNGTNVPGTQGEDDSGSFGTGVAGLTEQGVGTAGVGLGTGSSSVGWGGFFGTAGDNANAWGLVAQGCTPFTGGTCTISQAGWFQGDVKIDGNLTINGICTGCASAVIAVNGSDSVIRRGDAVTVVGARAAGGTTLLLVAPATSGHMIVGIADTEMVPRTSSVRSFRPARLGQYLATAHTTRRETSYRAGGTSVAPNHYVLVVTQGIMLFASADASAGAIRAGESLAASATAGRLAVAKPISVQGHSFTIPGTSVGYALGSLSRGAGVIAIFVSPH